MRENVIIPIVPTSFIGRQHELIEVTRLLAASRLVTLVGTAGCGKTRLALRAAQEINGRYPHGIHWLELAPLTDAILLPQLIAKALRLKEQAERPLLQTIIAALKARNSLLILDNCEHLRTACAEFVTILLAETSVSILTTSREPLRVTGEKLYPVPSLSLPQRLLSLNAVAVVSQSDAIQLFIERAGAILPHFALTADNVDIVANICHQLDGLPLAIEMAAARVNVLTVTQIANRLDNHFALLAPTAYINSPHQTLRAAIDWSYDLLTAPEQLLLRRLSVFAGGCSLGEVESVCVGDGIEREQVLDLLASLVDKSLVTAVTLQRSQARYTLLETIRQYGQEKLRDADEWSRIHDRHLQCFLQLAEETEPKLRGEYQKLWLNWLEDEYDNIRAALGWSIKNSQVEQGLRIIIALYQFWIIRDHVEEGLIWLQRLLADADESLSPVVHANALAYASFMTGSRGNAEAQIEYGLKAAILAKAGDQEKSALAWALVAQGFGARAARDYPTAFVFLKQSVQLHRELKNWYFLGLVLIATAYTAISLNKYSQARAMFSESLLLLRKSGNPYRIAMALNYSGDLARCEGDYAEAQSLYEESIPLLRKLDAWRDLASAIQNLGHTCLHLGKIDQATALFNESMASHQEQENQSGMTEGLLGFAALAIVTDLPEAGAKLLAAAAAIGGQYLTSGWVATSMEYEHYLNRAHNTLSEKVFQSAQTAGQRMSLEQAIALAEDVGLKTAVIHQTQQQLNPLTPREHEVSILIARGRSNEEIATELVVSKRTVEKHIANVRSKLDFTERTQLVRWVIENGLVEIGK